MQQAQALPQPASRNVHTLCMRCFLKAVLKKHGIRWNDAEELAKLADGWGSCHIKWLERYLSGEIAWLPQLHVNALIVLLDLTPGQESIFEKMNRRDFFAQPEAQGDVACPCCRE